ncbi:MAG: hypothetical protein J7L58_01930, partial [Thermoplasmata archaeon]|nr:hypothetical protein [Thermoplasmata archaeon]
LSGHFVRKVVVYDEDGDNFIDREWRRGDKIPEDVPFYPDFNRDGYVSAEEVHKYIWWWRVEYLPNTEHPQISDGYPSLMDNSDELILTELN